MKDSNFFCTWSWTRERCARA